MSWGTPTDCGIKVNTSSTTVSLTNVTVPGGALIVVFVADVSGSTMGPLSDGVNTYSLATHAGNTTAYPNIGIFYSSNVTALSNATVTYTANSSGGAAIEVVYVTGELAASPLDLVATPVTSSLATSVTVTSGTPSQSNELFFGMSAVKDGLGGITQASGFSAPPNGSSYGSSDYPYSGGYLINSGSSAVSYQPTFSGPAGCTGLLVSFKQAATLIPVVTNDDNGFLVHAKTIRMVSY